MGVTNLRATVLRLNSMKMSWNFYHGRIVENKKFLAALQPRYRAGASYRKAKKRFWGRRDPH
jgi:hypothetical protein